MEKSPAISFGLSACAAAMRAKAGLLTLRDQLDLARRALEFEAIDPDMRAEVLLFLDTCAADGVAAGVRLQAHALALADAIAPAMEARPHRHAWQDRKDCGQ